MRNAYRQLLLALTLFLALTSVAAAPGIAIRVEPERVAVGDPISLTVTLSLPSDTEFDPPPGLNTLGPFEVVESVWTPPGESTGDVYEWTWQATLRIFRTGEHSIPPLSFSYGVGGEQRLELSSTRVTVTSVVDPDEWDAGAPDRADLKQPVSIAPDYTALWVAAAVLLLLLLVALLVWYLQRRYAGNFTAVATPSDPFQRMPPHEWVYQEIQRLLERRLPETGQVDLFYAELSRIAKWYVTGRFRVDLMERTTAEVRPTLVRAGAPEEALGPLLALLQDADQVKFARSRPGSDAWKGSVERVYTLVDRTRPRAEQEGIS